MNLRTIELVILKKIVKTENIEELAVVVAVAVAEVGLEDAECAEVVVIFGDLGPTIAMNTLKMGNAFIVCILHTLLLYSFTNNLKPENQDVPISEKWPDVDEEME